MRAFASLHRLPAAGVMSLGLVLVLVVGAADYLTGKEISFSLFYVLPVFVVTWFGNRPCGMVISLMSAVAWLVADLEAGHQYSHFVIPYWNAAIRMGFFALVTQLLSGLRDALNKEQELVAGLQRALANVRRLEGLLPICAWCKRVRDSKGYWSQVERYVAEHSEAEFTHGICPECREKVKEESLASGSSKGAQ